MALCFDGGLPRLTGDLHAAFSGHVHYGKFAERWSEEMDLCSEATIHSNDVLAASTPLTAPLQRQGQLKA
jgi:hypothetical protein